MENPRKRALLYGGAAVAIGALALGLAHGRTDADVDTLLSGANVQLRLAYAMPERDLQGKVLDTRASLIAEAERQLEAAERQEPGLACTAEFRGFAHMLRGEHAAAAAAYARARGCADCQDEQRDVLAFNEARELAKAGQSEQALAVFARHGQELDSRFGHQRAIEEAGILRGLSRAGEARARLRPVLADEAAPPMAWLQAGQELERLGDHAEAEATYLRVRTAVPIADFHLARLKLLQGATDSAFELLGRAEKAAPAEVRRLVREDPDAWRVVAEDARFLQLTAPRAAAPGR